MKFELGISKNTLILTSNLDGHEQALIHHRLARLSQIPNSPEPAWITARISGDQPHQKIVLTRPIDGTVSTIEFFLRNVLTNKILYRKNTIVM